MAASPSGRRFVLPMITAIKTCCVQEFTSTGSANTETSKVAGSLETKYKWAEHGVTFTEKWNTDNTLGTEITVEDQVGDRGMSV